jgi:hypothetical protein
MEQRTMKYINERLALFQENLNAYRTELNEAVVGFGKKTDDAKGETLWRIKDCEELLRSRVSDKYVDDAVKSLNEQISRQLSN